MPALQETSEAILFALFHLVVFTSVTAYHYML